MILYESIEKDESAFEEPTFDKAYDAESDASSKNQVMYDDDDRYITDLIKGYGSVIRGNDRGTLYHKVLELLDLTK